MARHDRESIHDADTHDLLFGDPDDHDLDSAPADHEGADVGPRRPRPSRPASRSELRHAERTRRGRRTFTVIVVLLVAVVGAGIYFAGLPAYRYFVPSDYDGSGTGSVVVTVRANQGASDIARTLTSAGVVGSERAFVNAAEDDDRSQDIQPGSYRLHHHMSAASALSLLLTPSSRVDNDTVVTEGQTVVDVENRLVAKPCDDGASSPQGCGLGLSRTAVTKALTDVGNLGIPTDYLPSGKNPTSAEGFLFPATYTFDDETTVTDALQQMVGKFTDQARATGFSSKAAAIGLTPYQALTVASIAQAEAKFPEDFAKVARVILNRIAAKRPLQIDATSAYAAKLKGLDPTEEIYSQTKGPFNTYTHSGLPPTPIGNPGADAMAGAVAPAAGSWMFYVNKDAAGHLGFYTDEKSFTAAQQKCHDQGWGCAAP